MYLSRLKSITVLPVALLALSQFCAAAEVTANAAAEVGTSPGTLNGGDSTSGTFSFIYTFADTDMYSVSGSYSTSYIGGTTKIAFTTDVGYIGNSTHTVTSSTDVLTLDLLQDYNFTGNPNGLYSSHSILFLPPVTGAGSFTEAQVFYDSQSTGLMGPYSGTTPQSFSTSATLNGLTTPLDANFQFVYSFAPGTAPIPEPTEAGLWGLGLVALGLFAEHRRKRIHRNTGREN